MNAELKAKWIEALRGGKYEQGQSFLRYEGKFCCLGVLCDIVDPDGWDTNGSHIGGANSFPDRTVLRICNVSEDSGEKEHPLWPLAYMNDSGKSFAEIADFIEANL